MKSGEEFYIDVNKFVKLRDALLNMKSNFFVQVDEANIINTTEIRKVSVDQPAFCTRREVLEAISSAEQNKAVEIRK